MQTLEQLNQQIVVHNAHRKHFERTPEEMALSIVEEAKELVAEIQRALVTSEVWNVAGEVGDLYILLGQLCDDLGIDPIHAFQMKMARNSQKYDDYVTNSGSDKEESKKLSKKI